jgi:quinol monooxygenase YgiN
MIRVIAIADVHPGKKAEFMEILNGNIPNVRQENGCLEYVAASDVDAGLGNQVMDENQVMVIEQWESLDALKAHLETPHMQSFREKVSDLVKGVSLRVLQ